MNSSSTAMRTLRNINEARVKFREADCSFKLKKVRSQKINPSVEQFYQMGDPILFRDQKKREWKQGTALVRFGKTLYVKYGNFLRRVPIDLVIPDSVGAEKMEESFVEPLDREEVRFLNQEIPIEALTEDLETAKMIEGLKCVFLQQF